MYEISLKTLVVFFTINLVRLLSINILKVIDLNYNIFKSLFYFIYYFFRVNFLNVIKIN